MSPFSEKGCQCHECIVERERQRNYPFLNAMPRYTVSGNIHEWRGIANEPKEYTVLMAHRWMGPDNDPQWKDPVVGKVREWDLRSDGSIRIRGEFGDRSMLNEWTSRLTSIDDVGRYLQQYYEENTKMPLYDIQFNVSTNSTTTPDQCILSEIEARAKDNPAMVVKIKEAAEKAEREYKDRITRALAGSAELELIKGPQGKRFVVKYFYRGKEYTTYGVAYEGYGATEEYEKDIKGDSILIRDDNSPVFDSCSYKSMRRVKLVLERANSPYVIKFFD
jgi:hypothetical protein